MAKLYDHRSARGASVAARWRFLRDESGDLCGKGGGRGGWLTLSMVTRTA